MVQQELIDPDLIEIPSMSTIGVYYTLNKKEKTCTCPAFTKCKKKKPECKHLYEHGVLKKKMVNYPTHPAYSQAMSAYVKAVRLRETQRAIYWLMYLWFQHSKEMHRIRRRVWIAATEDGCHMKTQQTATDWMVKMPHGYGTERDFLSAARLTYLICQSPNWWAQESAYNYIYSWAQGEVLAAAWKKDPITSLQTKLTNMFGYADKGMGAHTIGSLILLDLKDTKEKDIFINEVRDYADVIGHTECLAMIDMYAVKGGRDTNYAGHALYRLACGAFGDQSDVSVDTAAVDDMLAAASLEWKTNPQPVPKHYCDGIHCTGEDRRFSGCSIDMWAAINAFKHYGRLHPDDKWMYAFKSLTV